MNATLIGRGIAGALVAVLLTLLFRLYQDPLLEISLAGWGLC